MLYEILDIFRLTICLKYSRKSNEVYPLVSVSLDWINSFLEMDGRDLIESENRNEIAGSFSEFLEDVAPQYRENVLKAAEYIDEKLNSQ